MPKFYVKVSYDAKIEVDDDSTEEASEYALMEMVELILGDGIQWNVEECSVVEDG